MKSGLSFFLGMIVGGVVVFGILVIYAKKQLDSDERGKVSMFKEPGAEMDYVSQIGRRCTFTGFEVQSVFPTGAALAVGKNGGVTIYSADVFLLPLKEGCYYDDQYVGVPPGHVARHAGIYRYTTKGGDVKTIPVVKFYPKK